MYNAQKNDALCAVGQEFRHLRFHRQTIVFRYQLQVIPRGLTVCLEFVNILRQLIVVYFRSSRCCTNLKQRKSDFLFFYLSFI